ncbi:flagellar brake protein [Ornithinibacillus halophilus]|uniref:C-di-GMP-binding flagellar brake protein YcgR, contains PilZNR and PilZ domains n=1 Tax=Ornithinibacillus halophilus TaxID=930117 RepID=A0A1M5CRA0_9BACI|nr:PilZ domain-containing protein [Ornithinibacillus halophilus]SHF57291.1 c-di-GMP-binding flagellar brake protein YcgR, contains PilZNR and PilZ domains [Ornithinibacillus halophilus]
MRIGTLLNIERFYSNGEKEEYQSKIIERDNQYIYIDLPVHVQSRRTTFISIDTPIYASYVGKDHSIYRFKTFIKKKTTLTIPALAIELPQPEQIERIQRRQFVRIEIQVDVAVHSKLDKFRPFSTVTNDISGGGLSIILPDGEELTSGQSVNTWIVLSNQTGSYEYITIQCEVIRVLNNNNQPRTASLKFINIDSHTQQKIIQFCFEKQREARQKEIR